MKLSSFLMATTAAVAMATSAVAQDKPAVEVIHHWVSESEAAALGTIRDTLATKGVDFLDSAVGGLSGANANQTIRSRIIAGDPPTAMQTFGFEITTWASEGQLLTLDDQAAAGNWDAVVPDVMKQFVKYQDHWVATPVNIHRTNWVWGNAKVLADNGIEIPKTWDELVAAGVKLKAAGLVPIAMSDESWQIGLIFGAILNDLNGPEFYQTVTRDLDTAALSGPEMLATFDMLRKVSTLADPGYVGRDWAVASNMVATGEAGMQVMGDWAKGEFLGKGLKPGQDFVCFATPSAHPAFLYVADTLVFFKTDDPARKEASFKLAESAMDAEAQKKFNLIKGSIPARTDVAMDGFDDCGVQSANDLKTAIAGNSFMGNLSDGMSAEPQFTAVFVEVAAQFFVNPGMTSQEAVDMLVSGIDNAR